MEIICLIIDNLWHLLRPLSPSERKASKCFPMWSSAGGHGLLWSACCQINWTSRPDKTYPCSYQPARFQPFWSAVTCSALVHFKGCTLMSSFLLSVALRQLQQKTITSILSTAAPEGDDEVGLVSFFSFFFFFSFFNFSPPNGYITPDWTAQCIDLLSISPKSAVICSCQGDKVCSALRTKLVWLLPAHRRTLSLTLCAYWILQFV